MIDESKLHDNISLAHRAKSAYDGYLKEYLKNCYQVLFAQFLEAVTVEQMQEVKQVKLSLDVLHDSIKADIDNGVYAEIQLRSKNNP